MRKSMRSLNQYYYRIIDSRLACREKNRYFDCDRQNRQRSIKAIYGPWLNKT